MHTVELVWMLAFAFLLLAALVGGAPVHRLALASARPIRTSEPEPQPQPEPGEEQLPETDRAPRRRGHVLLYTVALAAFARIVLLVALDR
jgi:hypothetical protein